jgi:hypothetical protein
VAIFFLPITKYALCSHDMLCYAILCNAMGLWYSIWLIVHCYAICVVRCCTELCYALCTRFVYLGSIFFAWCTWCNSDSGVLQHYCLLLMLSVLPCIVCAQAQSLCATHCIPSLYYHLLLDIITTPPVRSAPIYFCKEGRRWYNILLVGMLFVKRTWSKA